MTILVADDDPITLESLEACLKLEGFDVALAKLEELTGMEMES